MTGELTTLRYRLESRQQFRQITYRYDRSKDEFYTQHGQKRFTLTGCIKILENVNVDSVRFYRGLVQP